MLISGGPEIALPVAYCLLLVSSEADIKEGEEKKAQLDEDLKQHQADRAAAKAAMAEATALRKKDQNAAKATGNGQQAIGNSPPPNHQISA